MITSNPNNYAAISAITAFIDAEMFDGESYTQAGDFMVFLRRDDDAQEIVIDSEAFENIAVLNLDAFIKGGDLYTVRKGADADIFEQVDEMLEAVFEQNGVRV